MEWLTKAPKFVIITVSVLVGTTVLALIGGFVALELAGQPTEDYRAFINTLMNGVMVVLAGIGAVGGAAAARSASQAADQTNGQLTTRDTTISDQADVIAAQTETIERLRKQLP